MRRRSLSKVDVRGLAGILMMVSFTNTTGEVAVLMTVLYTRFLSAYQQVRDYLCNQPLRK
jgi:hypothetical protein